MPMPPTADEAARAVVAKAIIAYRRNTLTQITWDAPFRTFPEAEWITRMACQLTKKPVPEFIPVTPMALLQYLLRVQP
ncbi:MAG TPA: hypothetical protein VFO16_01615 [Pseudonocardiaceae bacterium]|nr:hypothetical protein [Pseudonocardiaceae bacterium]